MLVTRFRKKKKQLNHKVLPVLKTKLILLDDFSYKYLLGKKMNTARLFNIN